MARRPERLVRVHVNPLFVPNPPLDPPGQHRFDDPLGEFVVRYTGESVKACLLETMVVFRRQDIEALLAPVSGIETGDRDPMLIAGLEQWLDAQRVATFDVEDRRMFLDLNDAQVLVELDKHPRVREAIENSGLGTPLDPQHLDEALIRLGGPVGRCITQAVSRAIHDWHDDVDGILYLSHHDDAATCCAVRSPHTSWRVLENRPFSPDNEEDRQAVREVARLFEIPLPIKWS